MTLNPEICYQALLSQDPRFDGKFYVGISTTRIYCRPVCASKKPTTEHCTYYPSAAAAEQAGYRPCLRCRPELAPGNAHMEAANPLAAAIASRIEDGALDGIGLEALATEFHLSERHLRRILQAEYGVSPVKLAQTHRLLTAKRLLTDTTLPITEIAFASGFNSLRRFNTLFQARYRMNPTELRNNKENKIISDILTCELAYLPPLDFQTLLVYLKRWAAAGVETVTDTGYLRSLSLTGHSGWIRVECNRQKSTLQVNLSAGLAPVLLQVLTRTKRLFDLAAHPGMINRSLGELAEGNSGLRLPGSFDGFEVAVHAVLSQQVSSSAARQVVGRLVKSFGQNIETPHPQINLLFPTSQRLANASVSDLASLGMFRSKANAILELATALEAKTLKLEPGVNVAETIQLLKAIPGIGDWTAQYIAMRALGWPDAFPYTDLGLRKALRINNSR